MKHLILLSVVLTILKSSISQEFLWAKSFDIPNCNEVAALTVDTSGNIFLSGVYNASQYLPYTGNCYVIKTNPDGEVIWTNYFAGTLQIGDMLAVGNSAIIIGQSNGYFTYEGEQYGNTGYYMFIMKIDSNGNHVWHYTDAAKNGMRANLNAGKFGDVAMNIREISNIGDWVWIMDENGNLLKSKQISSSTGNIVDLAYYNDRVYLNGGFNGPGSLIIDTIVINSPPVENAAFVLALNDSLKAEWVSIDTTINNQDGRIEANDHGVFVYESVIEPPFTLVNTIKKFSTSGQFLVEIAAPVFSTSVTLYPDMALTSDNLGLFAENDFNFDSHKLTMFDYNLSVITGLVINGSSDLYSGQISGFGEDFFVAYVHSGDLNFNNQLILPYNSSGKLPYLAKAGMPPINTGFLTAYEDPDEITVFPNPASHSVAVYFNSLQPAGTLLSIVDARGTVVSTAPVHEALNRFDIGMLKPGIYFIRTIQKNGKCLQKKILIK
jgi:hypothetical protein